MADEKKQSNIKILFGGLVILILLLALLYLVTDPIGKFKAQGGDEFTGGSTCPPPLKSDAGGCVCECPENEEPPSPCCKCSNECLNAGSKCPCESGDSSPIFMEDKESGDQEDTTWGRIKALFR